MAVSLLFCRVNMRMHISLLVARLCAYRRPSSFLYSAAGEASASSLSEFDPKVFRQNLMRSKNYNRKSFGYKEETLERKSQEYTRYGSTVVTRMRVPFTPSQWMELERQALIYKYITSNVSIPSSLLNPTMRAFESVA